MVILGAGKLGLSALDVLCHSAGACLTIATDLQPFRLETARKLGADHVIDVAQGDPVEQVLEITQGVGVDCVIEAVGHYHLPPGQSAPLAQAVLAALAVTLWDEKPEKIELGPIAIPSAELTPTQIARSNNLPEKPVYMALGVAAGDETFTDDFAPLAEHVYRIDPKTRPGGGPLPGAVPGRRPGRCRRGGGIPSLPR